MASQGPAQGMGDWLLVQDATTGDLIAIDSDGHTTVIATKGTP